MLNLLWLIPVLPLTGFVILILTGRRMPRNTVAVISVATVLACTVITAVVTAGFVGLSEEHKSYIQVLLTWLNIDNLNVNFAFHLDALSVVMSCVVSFVGLLIVIYSTQFMSGDEDYSRFFAYMNLFIGSMLILVLADNLLFLYMGWEGVGLCSYLLIGFWYRDPANVKAALKAFIVTRVGDALLLIGIFITFWHFGTLDIQQVNLKVSQFPVGSALPVAMALLFLAGAIGKSAQLPLQVWLPDAMAGPTPVSALIHAATMVTAGVYLIARTNAVFRMAPDVMLLVAVIGAMGLLLAGFSALVQRDIKRILAYSTISQIGYMFLALGVGAWSAAIFHFATHALFKSALFLGAGAVILSMNQEHDIFKMGGLSKHFSLLTTAFLSASLVLTAIPPFTLTFNSKDLILSAVWQSQRGGMLLWVIGTAGAFLTALYTFRLFFIVFFGPVRQNPVHRPGLIMMAPFTILAFLAAIAGLPELLSVLFGIDILNNFLHTALPPTPARPLGIIKDITFQAVYTVIALTGIWICFHIYLRKNIYWEKLLSRPLTANLRQLMFANWGFDWLYDRLWVRPYLWITQANKSDVVDKPFVMLSKTAELIHQLTAKTQNGRLRWYVAGIGCGATAVLAMVIFL
jgi:NADH-quinone oxidoreductase subunit L